MDAASVSATPQTPSSRLKKSLAWVCFNSFGDEKKAQCRSCGGVVTWTDAKCTTRTMWWHLYSKHRNQHDKLKIMADKLKMTYDGARQKVNFDHPLDTDRVPSTSDSGEKENEVSEVARFIQDQINELFASEMGKNADIPSLLTPRPPRRRPGAHLAQAVAEAPMSPMHSNLDIMSEGSRASSPNTVAPSHSHSSPSPSPSDATHEGGFSQHSMIAPRTPLSINGYAAIDFSTPLSPGANGDRQYIKRPLNAYMMWTREERKKILADDPKKKMHDISREMGERWKSMTDQQKKPYFEKAKAQKAEHKKMLKEHPNWVYQPNKMKGKKKISPTTNEKTTPCTPAPATPAASTNGRSTAVAAPSGSGSAVRSGSTFQRPAPPQQGQQSSVAAALLSTPQQQPARLATPATTAGGPMRVVPGGMSNGSQNVVYHPYASNQTPRYAQGPNGQTYVLQQNGHPQSSVRVGQHTYVAQALAAKPGHPQGGPPQQTQVAKPASINQVLDMYYTSLCQPAFPEPGEAPRLGMRPSDEYYDQLQYLQQQYHHQHHYQQQQQQFTSSNGMTYQSI